MLKKAHTHSRNVKLLTALLVVAVAGSASGLALAGGSGLGINAPIPADKAAALSRFASIGTTDANTNPAPVPAFKPDPIPAEVLGPDVPVPIPSSTIQTTNGWLVSNGYHLVAVYAGAAGDDPSQGRVVIVRQDLVAGKQTVKIVDAGPTGSLTIANAPTGAAVESSALSGLLGLRSPNGTMATLHLATDRIGN